MAELPAGEAARRMRQLSERERDEAIAASPNVVDKRDLFADRHKQVALARTYRRPTTPKGPA